MILGEDPKHVSQLNINLSLILGLCLSPILSLSLSPDLSLCLSLRRSWSWSWFSRSCIVCFSLSLNIWGHLGAFGSIWDHLGASGSIWDLRMNLDLNLDLGVHLDLDKKTCVSCRLFLTSTLKKLYVYCTFRLKVIIWLEVCVSSGHFTRCF